MGWQDAPVVDQQPAQPQAPQQPQAQSSAPAWMSAPAVEQPKAKAPAQDYKPLVMQAASKYGIDPRLLESQLNAESAGVSNAMSPKGAQGLMQLMPSTAKDLGVTDPNDPAQSIDGGAKYMRQLLDKYGNNHEMALAAYNWGPGNLDKFGLAKAPKETRDYIAKIKGGAGNPDVPIPGVTGDTQYKAPVPTLEQGGTLPSTDNPNLDMAARLLTGFRKGLVNDIPDAATQLVSALIPDTLERKLSVENMTGAERVAASEAQYQKQREALGGKGVDAGRLIGNVANPANLALGAGGGVAAELPAWYARLGPKAQAVFGAMFRGGAAGAMQPVDTTNQSVLGGKAQQVALGAATGPIAEGVANVASKGIGKLMGAARGEMQPQAQQVMDLAKQYDVPITAGDIQPSNKIYTGIEGALENVRAPGIGMVAQRESTQLGAKQAAQKLVDDEFKSLQSMTFQSVDRLKTLASTDSIRAPEARRVLQMVADAGPDEKAIMKASGNLMWLNKKISADKLYAAVDDIAGAAPVAPTSTLTTINKALEDLPKAVDSDPATLKLLEKWRGQLEGTPAAESTDAIQSAVNQMDGAVADAVPNTYARMRQFATDVNKRIDAATTDGTTDSAKLFLVKVAKAANKDMEDFASSTPGLKDAADRASKFYQDHVVPYQARNLAKALTSKDPDRIYGAFVHSQAQGRGDYAAQSFWKALDNKGRQAVRYGIVKDAMTSATDDTGFSAMKFRDAINSTEYKQYFRGPESQRVQGIIDLFGHLKNSTPEHLQHYSPIFGGMLGLGVVSSAALNVPAAATGYGGATFLRWLMTSDSGKRLLFSVNALSKNGSSAKMGSILDTMARQFGAAAGTAAGAEAGKPGRVLP